MQVPDCSVCRNLLDFEEHDSQQPENLPAVHRVFGSARSGCARCFILWQFAHHSIRLSHEARGWTFAYSQGTYCSLQLEMEYWHPKHGSCAQIDGPAQRTPRLNIFSTDGRTYKFGDHRILPSVKLARGNFLRDSYVTARKWLVECCDSHGSICGSITDQQLPARVLDLGESPGEYDDLKLHETAAKEIGRYVCLAHCWGPLGSAIKTTANNLAQHKAHISLSALPRTFQEAVVFTRWLGVRYLWIDALCIIQGDKADWLRQSTVMASVYSGSFLTLSAAKAASGQSGLFSSERHDVVEAAIDHMDERGLYKGRFFMRTIIPHEILNANKPCDWGSERHPFKVFPLLARAWAFRERVLAPRVLHFGNQELCWECQRYVHCECGHPGSTDEAKDAFKAMIAANQSRSSAIERFNSWKELVSLFSARRITFPTDRLPAISGIAKCLAECLPKAKYLADLWSTDAFALLWELSTIESQQIFSETSGPLCEWPSWSWAKVDGAVNYYIVGANDVSHCRIVALVDRSIYGHVDTGELVVEGPLEPVTYSQCSPLSERSHFLRKDGRWQFRTLSIRLWRGWLSWDAGRPAESWHASCEDSFYLVRLVVVLGRREYFVILRKVEGSDTDPAGVRFRRYGMLEFVELQPYFWTGLDSACELA